MRSWWLCPRPTLCGVHAHASGRLCHGDVCGHDRLHKSTRTHNRPRHSTRPLSDTLLDLPTRDTLRLTGLFFWRCRMAPRVQYPCVFHVRCTETMRDEVRARGGGHWLRSLVEANSRPPVDTAEDEPIVLNPPHPSVSLAIASDTNRRKPAASGKRPRSRRRVSLDTKKRRR